MSERLVRLLKIITYVQNRPGITSRELTERLEISKRTLQRDIQVLGEANVPVVYDEDAKGYKFLGRFALFPLDWTERERRAFYMLPSLLEKIPNMFTPETLDAIHKVISAEGRKRAVDESVAKKWAEAIQTGTSVFFQGNSSSRFLSVLLEAIHDRRTIRAKYYTQSREAWTERNIDPYYLIPREHRFYLVGFCHNKKEVRMFRLSRFESIKLLPQTFTINNFDLERYMKHTWSILRGDRTIRFKVRFSPSVARYVKEEELFLKPVFSEQRDGTLLMEVTVNHDQEFLHWLAQYGENAEILSPLSYREKMKEQLSSWLKLYET